MESGVSHIMGLPGETIFIKYHFTKTLSLDAARIELAENGIVINSPGLPGGSDSQRMESLGDTAAAEGSYGRGQDYRVSVQVADL